jgi:hypothetical protein
VCRETSVRDVSYKRRIVQGTHRSRDASFKGRIVQGTNRLREASSKERIAQVTHRPRNASSKERIVQGKHRPRDLCSQKKTFLGRYIRGRIVMASFWPVPQILQLVQDDAFVRKKSYVHPQAPGWFATFLKIDHRKINLI